MTDNKEIVVVQRKLLVEVVVSSEELSDRIIKMVQEVDERVRQERISFVVDSCEKMADGHHIRILCEWRQQMHLQNILAEISTVLGLHFRDQTLQQPSSD